MSGLEGLLLAGAGSGAGVGAAAAGAGLGFLGTIMQGQQAKKQAEYDAEVQEAQGDEALAAAQRDSINKKRQGDLIMSKQRAAVGASGGSLAEGSVLDIMGQTQREIDLGMDTSMYQGEQQHRGYNDAAEVSRANGKNAVTNSYLSAAGNLFSSASSMYSRFGMPNTQATSSSSFMSPY